MEKTKAADAKEKATAWKEASSKGPVVSAEDIDWAIGNTASTYTPVEYIAPWDKPEWGLNDIARTVDQQQQREAQYPAKQINEGQRDYVFIPTEKEARTEDKLREGRPYNPIGVEENQRDYIYMPTEKEIMRNEAYKKKERPTPWQEQPDPGEYFVADYVRRQPVITRPPTKSTAPPKYKRWQDQVTPPEREWGESRPDEMYIQIEGPGNPSWEARNPVRRSRNPSGSELIARLLG